MSHVLGVFEQAVLVAVMRLRGDGYGRTIHKEVVARLDRDVTASAVYATLDRLEDKSLIASRAGEGTPQRGGRAKRHFTVTAAGVRALNATRAATHNIWRGLAFPLKLRP
jgi:DNA-binding PadR family transcriptional regulator